MKMPETFAGFDIESLVPRPKTSFFKVKCQCGNEQAVFSASSSKVKCLVCGKLLAKSSSSKAKLLAKKVKDLS